MVEIEKIWSEYWTNRWVSSDGLGRLDPYPIDTNTNPKGEETVNNENGILFLTEMTFVADLARIDVHNKRDHFHNTIDSLQCFNLLGIFNRHPHGKVKPIRDDAHDNMAAICAASNLYDFPYPKYIISFGERNAFCYDNVSPDFPRVFTQRQPGEIAFYRFSADYPIPIWEFLWFLIGILINAFKTDAGETKLTWLRLRALKIGEAKWHSSIFKFLSYLTTKFWVYKKSKIFPKGLSDVLSKYYRQDHPIVSMSKYIEGFGL